MLSICGEPLSAHMHANMKRRHLTLICNKLFPCCRDCCSLRVGLVIGWSLTVLGLDSFNRLAV